MFSSSTIHIKHRYFFLIQGKLMTFLIFFLTYQIFLSIFQIFWIIYSSLFRLMSPQVQPGAPWPESGSFQKLLLRSLHIFSSSWINNWYLHKYLSLNVISALWTISSRIDILDGLFELVLKTYPFTYFPLLGSATWYLHLESKRDINMVLLVGAFEIN